MADRDNVINMIGDLQKQVTAMELFASEGDPDSLSEARDLLKSAQNSINELKQELQTSTPLGMCVTDTRLALRNYSGVALVEVCVPLGNGNGNSYYLIDSITDIMGSAPTIPVINLGDCIST
jgi:hypothetical protein